MIPELPSYDVFYGGYGMKPEKNIIDTLYDEERYEGKIIKRMDNSDLIKAVVDLRKNAKKKQIESRILLFR